MVVESDASPEVIAYAHKLGAPAACRARWCLTHMARSSRLAVVTTEIRLLLDLPIVGAWLLGWAEMRCAASRRARGYRHTGRDLLARSYACGSSPKDENTFSSY